MNIFLVSLLLPISTTIAQNTSEIILPEVTTDPSIWYNQFQGISNSRLQIGIAADMSQKTPHSHPYFKVNIWENGDLIYRKAKFHDIQMLYNIERDALIIKRVDHQEAFPQPLELKASDVSSFKINGFDFVYIGEQVDPFTTGFMQVLYSGKKIDLLAKRTKNFKIDEKSKLAYLKTDRYYIKMNGSYYRIRRLSTIKNLLKDQKKGINEFVKENNFKNLKPENEYLFALLIGYCDKMIIE